jgi:hypothetical protein
MQRHGENLTLDSDEQSMMVGFENASPLDKLPDI